ncbi:ankyrin repeat-containing domain protein [Mycena albidolilacea]|uniref:Ankyrin repeat-containing domain protein n=1 Tax=Mycena albidolilacea TaxID=1033008 RepID=A0AAD7A156_9AGAR|nr:ankyrin repeat-containing domain protein [Mycena albidolilacea]
MLFEGGGYWGRALQTASSIGRRDIVELLLEHGANVHARGDRHGCAIQAAVYGANLDIVSSNCISAVEFSNIGLAQGKEYGTSLQVAAHGGNLKIVQLLLEHGANVNAPGRRAATYNGHENIVKLVLDQGADVNTAGEHRGRPRSRLLCLWGSYVEIVKVLLERGANVSVKRSFFSPSWLHYRSALQIAVDKPFKEIVKVLLDSGATPLSHKESIG